jgi:hypothetical protein
MRTFFLLLPPFFFALLLASLPGVRLWLLLSPFYLIQTLYLSFPSNKTHRNTNKAHAARTSSTTCARCAFNAKHTRDCGREGWEIGILIFNFLILVFLISLISLRTCAFYYLLQLTFNILSR